MDKIEVKWLNKTAPKLVMNDDVMVEIYRSTYDNEYVVQITTSPETDSWDGLRVYLNDGEATGWK